MPTRGVMDIKIGGFTYSNAYCKLLKYSIHGTDKSVITLHGTSKISYPTAYREPKTLSFTLRVHAQGDGINGKNHYKDYPTTIKIQGCDNEANTVSNPGQNAWKEAITNGLPSRKWTARSIKEFHYTNAYCKRLKYTITGTDA